MYSIQSRLIGNNRSGEALSKLKGLVVHSTANPGASAENHYSYWNGMYRGTSVHYVLDWQDVLQLMPESEVAWHTGSWSANREWIGVELCETSDKTQFTEVMNRAIWFCADLLIRKGWNVKDHLWSHSGLRSLYKGVDHTDPYGYFERMGYSWKQFCIDVEVEMQKMRLAPPPVVVDDKSKVVALLEEALKLLKG